MKTYLALGLLSSLLLTSCSVDWNDANVKKIGELEKQVQNDTFKKKQECIYLIEATASYDRLNGFYSKELDTCLVSRSYLDKGQSSYRIVDLLNHKNIFETEDKMSFSAKIKELKGE